MLLDFMRKLLCANALFYFMDGIVNGHLLLQAEFDQKARSLHEEITNHVGFLMLQQMKWSMTDCFFLHFFSITFFNEHS